MTQVNPVVSAGSIDFALNDSVLADISAPQQASGNRPAPCDHYAVKRRGNFRCSKCLAHYVIDIHGARWIERQRNTRLPECRVAPAATPIAAGASFPETVGHGADVGRIGRTADRLVSHSEAIARSHEKAYRR